MVNPIDPVCDEDCFYAYVPVSSTPSMSATALGAHANIHVAADSRCRHPVQRPLLPRSTLVSQLLHACELSNRNTVPGRPRQGP